MEDGTIPRQKKKTEMFRFAQHDSAGYRMRILRKLLVS